MVQQYLLIVTPLLSCQNTVYAILLLFVIPQTPNFTTTTTDDGTPQKTRNQGNMSLIHHHLNTRLHLSRSVTKRNNTLTAITRHSPTIQEHNLQGGNQWLISATFTCPHSPLPSPTCHLLLLFIYTLGCQVFVCYYIIDMQFARLFVYLSGREGLNKRLERAMGLN